MMKRVLMICLAVCATLCAVAQGNRIYIEDFEVVPGGTVTVPVMLANQDTTRGVQFNVTLPQGLQYEEMDLSRMAKRLKFLINTTLKDEGFNVMIYQIGKASFAPGNEEVAQLTLRADETFAGGEITVWKCCGSTMDNKTLFMDGGTVSVKLPAGPFEGFLQESTPLGN